MKRILLFSLAAMLILAVALSGCGGGSGGNGGGGNDGNGGSSGNGKIVYTSGTTSVSNIYIMNLENNIVTSVTQLTKDTSSTINCCPSLSRDGSKVVFVKKTPGSTVQIYVVNADGLSDPILVYTCINTETTIMNAYPSWTPDGGKIIFAEIRKNAGATDPNGIGYCRIMNANGSNPQDIVLSLKGINSAPRVSLDGRIAYETLSCIWVCDFDGNTTVSNQNKVYTHDGFILADSPSWSPDGQTLIFSGYRSSDSSSYIFSISSPGSGTTATQRYTITNNLLDTPLFLQDGSKFIFAMFDINYHSNDIFSLNLDASGLTNLTKKEGYDGYSPPF